MSRLRLPPRVSRRAVRNQLRFMAGETTMEQPTARKQKPRAEREAGVTDAIKEWRKTRPDVRLWRQNVGEFQLRDGTFFRAGLCRGSSDFVGLHTVTITPSMVGRTVGVFFALELKKPGELPEDHQQEWLDEIRDAGAIAGVATSVEDAEAVLARWLQRVNADER